MIDLTELRARREKLQESYRNAVRASQEADGRMQTRYDTQKEDYAREAENIEQIVVRLEEQISYLEGLPVPRQDEFIEIGHIVTLQIGDEAPSTYLLVRSPGGLQIGDVQTLNVDSPVGRAIVGQRVGSRLDLRLGAAVTCVSVVSVAHLERQ